VTARILLVEDEEDLQRLAEKVLSTRGYIVTIASDGSAGVSHALEDATDLVLMDLRLPEIDGWEATRRIKAAKPDLPIIACSANVMESDVDRAQQAGCDAFLNKPYQISELLSTVARFIG